MSIYHLDYETTSACDITLGAYRYACDPTTRILMFAIAKDDGEPLPWSITDKNSKALAMLQEAIDTDSPIYSHNAQFELAVSTYRMVKDLGIEPPDINQWRCTLAMCRRAAAPESLAEASKFFGLAAPKDPRGKALIGVFSDQSKAVTLTSPDGLKFQCSSPILGITIEEGTFAAAFTGANYIIGKPFIPWNWAVQLKGAGVTMTVRDAWELFCDYCKQDVRVEQELHRTIKHFELKGDVLASFQFDLRMNWRGVPVNLSALRNADKTVEEIKARMSERFTSLTGLQPGQRGATLKWLQARGYAEENLQAATVERILSDPTGLTQDALKALTLRSLLSYAALAKIPTMIAAACDDGYVRGTMQWHVARTGRAGGRIIQPQNFRKSTIGDETHLCYHMLCEGWDSDWYEELWDSPLEAIASSIRHFIQRPGGNFFDADFSSVENKLLAWCVGETEELEMMVNGTDMYKVMATKLFNVEYDEVTKEQRSISKVIVLGCGYGVGGKSVKNTLELMFRIKRTRAECKEYVRIYRSTHTATVQAWRDLEDAAKAAVRKPGTEFEALDGKVSFRAGRVAKTNYLTFRLPSGRRIYYPEPIIKDKFRPYDEEEMLEEPWKREERGYWVEELSFYGKITGKGTLGRIGTYGSKWLENLCQAMGADLLDHACQQVEKEGFDICMVIHDQILALEDGRHVDDLVDVFCRVPEWASTFPQAASGSVQKFYTKD